MRLAIDGAPHQARLQALGGNRYRLAIGDAASELAVLACGPDGMTLASDHGFERLAWAWDDDTLVVSLRGRQCRLHDDSLRGAGRAETAHGGAIRAPMAGRIVALQVAAGDTVRKGQPLLVLEAMKMEHPSLAPADATVARVCVEPGAQVATGALLVELTLSPGGPAAR
jgi:acetyl/propionyl-CoA carboxylase alpha subunit